MATDVVMPRLSDTMEEGTIVKWLKHVGDQVGVGDVLAEVETDKATMELESFDAGVLSEIRVDEGAAAAVGAVIAVLGDAGAESAKPKPAAKEPPSKEPPAKKPPTAPPAPAKEPPAEEPPAEEPPAKRPPAGEPSETPPVREPPAEKPTVQSQPGGPAATISPAPRPAGAPAGDADRVRASPRARRLASEQGIDLSAVRGSGPDGRVLESDLEAHASRPAESPAPAREAPAARGAGAVRETGEARTPLNKIRRTTAQRMAAAKREVPHFYASSDIDVEALVGVKDELRGRGGEWQRVTVTHLVLKAVGLALRQVPKLNASWADDAVILHDAVNVGLATATEDGLLVPVIRGCDTGSLVELMRRAQGLVERVRSRRIAGDDLVGATFTVSNLGMYPVSQFAAVVNPPHAGILAVGAIRATPVVRGKQVVAGQLMTVTLSCDHRVVDGVIAGQFLDALKSRLEEPRTLLE